MKKILLYMWCLPQNLLGLLFRTIYKGNDSEYGDAVVRRSLRMKGGISLGRYIVVNQFSSLGTIKHEYGHSIQSKRWGWLYLLVIGLQSVLHAALCKCEGHSYYDMWFERNADKLGGVQR